MILIKSDPYIWQKKKKELTVTFTNRNIQVCGLPCILHHNNHLEYLVFTWTRSYFKLKNPENALRWAQLLLT